EEITFTSHPHCGYATFIFVHNDMVTPIPRFVNVEGLFQRMEELTVKAKKYKILLKLVKKLKKKSDLQRLFDKYFGEFIDKNHMPEGLDIVDILSNLAFEKSKQAVGTFTWKTLMIGAMHFQDAYNYDIERVKRCVIHYATPDDRIIPFCAYNGGPTYRVEVEKKFSVPLDEWRKRNKKREKIE
ncbi:MAG: radical SAM protein, partial [Candidatus Thermoplasmatota archaeon]